jgi:hypothetical protein
MAHQTPTKCVKFNTAQFRRLGFFENPIFLSVVGLVVRNTIAQYAGRRLNSLPSTPFSNVALLIDG